MVKRKGFTFIEIALFLAVTAALFIGIALGMNNAITQQRYDDSIQEYFEFVRSIYSKVSNPQSPGKGNSNRAIYGKLVVFGEKYGIDHNLITEGNPIFVYDVVGDVIGYQKLGTERLVEMLSKLNLRLTSPEKFEMPWQTTIQDTSGNAFRGSILVVRHPRSGTINTLYSGMVVDANNPANTHDLQESTVTSFGTNNEIIFCLSPYPVGGPYGPIPKQPIKISSNARNASDVELVDLDDGGTLCH